VIAGPEFSHRVAKELHADVDFGQSRSTMT
jgi:hypothetical protein